MMSPVKTWPKIVLKAAIRAYQLGLSGFLGNRCRFYPSCSSYAMEAIDRHGAVKGSGLALSRLAKCHPLHPGGVDLVPGSCPAAPVQPVADTHSQSPSSSSPGDHHSLTHAH